jgi:hypothetical protein
MRILLIILFVLTYYSCKEKSNNKVNFIHDTLSDNFPTLITDRYFPTDTIVSSYNGREVDYHIKKWGSETLFFIKEPILCNYKGNVESIRFTWLRAFENPVVIRISKLNDTSLVRIKELSMKTAENDTPKIILDTIMTLKKELWEKAVSDLEKNNFLNKINRDTTLNKDGASWLLESRLNNSYHYIIRWDTGNAEGKELNTFAKTIIQIANGIVGIKSKR